MNLFKKLLRKEFGRKRYNGFAEVMYQKDGAETKKCRRLYDEMYEYCSRLDSERIIGMQIRLNEVMLQAFCVERTYALVFFIFIAAWFFLLKAGLQTEVLLVAIAAISVGFAVRTREYIINHYAYADAKMVETYQAVLDRIMISRARNRQEEPAEGKID